MQPSNRPILSNQCHICTTLVACRGEFVSRTQPLALVTAQFQTGFAEPRPEERY